MSRPSQPSGPVVVRRDLRRGVGGERLGGDDVGRQQDVERERVLGAHVFRHLPTDQHPVGPRAEVLAARRPCPRPSHRPRRSRTAARPRRAAPRGARARRAAAAPRRRAAGARPPRSRSAHGEPSRTRRSRTGRSRRRAPAAKPTSFFVSPSLKRVFSSTVTRSSPISSATRSRTGAIEYLARSSSVFGRPRCEHTRTSRAPPSSSSRSVGSDAWMRESSATRPFSSGTFRSALTRTTFPSTSASLTERGKAQAASLFTRSTSRHE